MAFLGGWVGLVDREEEGGFNEVLYVVGGGWVGGLGTSQSSLDIRPEERISWAEMSSSWVSSLVVGVRR